VRLDSNQVSDGGATALAKTLSTNATLTELHLAHNLVGVEGAAQLGSALEANASLQLLDLAHNAILDPGAASIARCGRRPLGADGGRAQSRLAAAG